MLRTICGSPVHIQSPQHGPCLCPAPYAVRPGSTLTGYCLCVYAPHHMWLRHHHLQTSVNIIIASTTIISTSSHCGQRNNSPMTSSPPPIMQQMRATSVGILLRLFRTFLGHGRTLKNMFFPLWSIIYLSISSLRSLFHKYPKLFSFFDPFLKNSYCKFEQNNVKIEFGEKGTLFSAIW